jgi:hypothetical protein
MILYYICRDFIPISKRIFSLSIIKTDRVLLFRREIGVYFENDLKYRNTLRHQNTVFVFIKGGGVCYAVTTELRKS